MLNLSKETKAETLYLYADSKGFTQSQLDEAVWRITRGLPVNEELLKTVMEYMTIYVLKQKKK